jgi:superfamily II helicase
VDKILIFVHSKRIGRNVTEALLKRKIRAAFYHAGLKPDERKFLEAQFKNQICDLNVLVTTSALAMGVNL